MKKIIAITVLLLCVTGGGVAYYMYNKKPVDTSEANADIVVNAVDVINDFTADVKKSSDKYKTQVTEITGAVTEVLDDHKTVVINGIIRCEMVGLITVRLEKNSPISIKGVYGGYDDFLEEILFVRCSYKN